MREKESSSKIFERVKRYRANPEHQKIEIIGLSPLEKKRFLNLSGLEGLNHRNKLNILIDLWEEHAENTMNFLLENQYKNFNLEEANLLKDCSIFNIEITNFIQKRKIPIKEMCLKMQSLIDFGINKKSYEDYLFYLKNQLPESTPKFFPKTFLDMILNKEYIELFKQKCEAERLEQENEKSLKLEYINQEISKGALYFLERKELYFNLIKKYRVTDDNKYIGLKVLSSSISLEKLISNRTIIKELLPDIQQRLDYPFTSFEDWKIHNLNI